MRESYQLRQRPESIPERTLGDLLNETFAVYGNNFRHIIGLAAVIQVPFAIIAQFIGEGQVAYSVEGLLGIFGSVFIYAAIASAVGQHYTRGEIDFGACYSRVALRIVSLSMLAGVLTLLMTTGLLLAFLVIPTIAVLMYLVYWSVGLQAVIVEGYKPVAALRRSFGLVRGSWWRVCGISVVVALVALGLGLVLTAPFAFASRIAAPDTATVLRDIIQFLNLLVVLTIVPPVAAIASTLLYFDLRVRREDYSLTTLSQEMGIATV